MRRRYVVVDILCSLSVCRLSDRLSGERFIFWSVFVRAEPLKKTMVIVEDDGTAFVLGERIANMTGEKVLR